MSSDAAAGAVLLDADSGASAASARSSVSSKLDSASKPQLIGLLTKQMARMKEADRRAAELSSQLATLQREREDDRQAAQAREDEWRTAMEQRAADVARLTQQLLDTETQLTHEAADKHRLQQTTHALQAQLEQLQTSLRQQQQQQQLLVNEPRARQSNGQAEGSGMEESRPQSQSPPAAAAATHTAEVPAAGVADSAGEDDQHALRLSVDVVELRHAAVVRSYEEKLGALNATLVKYKGVTAKLHDKLKAMAEQIKQLNSEQAAAVTQQAEAGRVIQQRADETSVVLTMVEAVMGNKERAQWEAEMRDEEQQALGVAAEQRGERSEGEQQQPAEDEAAARASTRHASGSAASTNGAGSAVSVNGSLSRLSRLLAAVQRQSGEVRRMKEESLSQLLALSQAQQTSQHNSHLSTSLNQQTQQLAEAQQRVSYLESALSACQSDLSSRDVKLSKLRSLLSRATKQSDEQKGRLAAHTSERDILLRCIANYRYLTSLPWSTLAACTPTAASTSATASPALSSMQPAPLSTSSPSSPPTASSFIPSAAASSISDDDSVASITDTTDYASSPPSPASVVLPPSPLDDAVDVDECQPVLRVTLSDCTHWLLLSTRRTTQLRAAATIALQKQQQQSEQDDERERDGDEGEARQRASHSHTEHVAEQLTSATAWPDSKSAFDSANHAFSHVPSLAVPPSSSAAAAAALDTPASDGSSARCLFWSDLRVYLAYKWKKYQAAAKHNTPHHTPFAVLQPPTSSTSSAAISAPTPGPPASAPLASFVSLLSSSASLSYSLLLFDGASVPADCLSLLSSSLSSVHSSVVSRLRAVHHHRVSALSSAARESEQSHESVVRDFSRYQQRTRELLAQKQRQLDELLGRDEETEGLRSSLSALSAQLEAVNRDKGSQGASLVALAQQLQACQADKERALISERSTTAALSALQADMRAVKEAAEAKLAVEQQRAQQAEEAAQRVARQMDDINRRAVAATAVAATAAAQQPVAEPNSTSPSASASSLTARHQQQLQHHSLGQAGESHFVDGEAAVTALSAAEQRSASAPSSSADSVSSASPTALTVTVPDSPTLSFLSAADGHSVHEAGGTSSSGELPSLRARVRSLQSLIQHREIALVQLQSALDASSGRCRSLESDLALLRSMESGSSNVEYLRNVLCRFLATDDDSLIPVLCTLLNVDKQQQSTIVAARAKHPHSHSHGRARQASGANPPAAQPPSFFAFF